MTSCRNGGTFEKKESTATQTKETEIVGVVGCLKKIAATPKFQTTPLSLNYLNRSLPLPKH